MASSGQLRASIVAGAANNVLAEDRHGAALRDRGILYAPDYAINSGGLINVATEYRSDGYNESVAHEKIAEVYGTMLEIFERASREGLPTNIVADGIARERIQNGS